jgi:hypothetical protein
MKPHFHAVALLCITVLLCSCARTHQLESKQTTGFLKDYSQLQPHKTESGAQAWRWISPQLSKNSYQHFEIDLLEFYPRPTTSDQVSYNALNDLRTSLDLSVRQSALLHELPLVEKTMPKTLTLRAALTSVALSDKKFQLRELFPIKLVWSGAELIMGKRDKDVTVLLEYEFLDAISGKSVIKGVRQDEGLRVANNKTQLSTKNIEPVLQGLIKDMDLEFKQLKTVFTAAK